MRLSVFPHLEQKSATLVIQLMRVVGWAIILLGLVTSSRPHQYISRTLERLIRAKECMFHD